MHYTFIIDTQKKQLNNIPIILSGLLQLFREEKFIDQNRIKATNIYVAKSRFLKGKMLILIEQHIGQARSQARSEIWQIRMTEFLKKEKIKKSLEDFIDLEVYEKPEYAKIRNQMTKLHEALTEELKTKVKKIESFKLNKKEFVSFI